jgi:MoaA/NifB/PqqE/SkfB family radical SAM enzyme
MTDETCRNAVSFAKDSGERLLIVSGGEPTDHPRFFDMCRIVSQSGLSFSICSNGMFMGDPKKEWQMEKVANLAGFCGGQIYSNPKWYRLHNQTIAKWNAQAPKWEMLHLHLDTTDIRGMQDLGRAKNCPEAIAEAEASPYHNSCLASCTTLVQSEDSHEFFNLMFMQHRFCTPLIDVAGNVHMSESWLCPSCGNVNTDTRDMLWLKMRSFRPCGGCIGCKRYLTEDTPKMAAARRLLGQA